MQKSLIEWVAPNFSLSHARAFVKAPALLTAALLATSAAAWGQAGSFTDAQVAAAERYCGDRGVRSLRDLGNGQLGVKCRRGGAALPPNSGAAAAAQPANSAFGGVAALTIAQSVVLLLGQTLAAGNDGTSSTGSTTGTR